MMEKQYLNSKTLKAPHFTEMVDGKPFVRRTCDLRSICLDLDLGVIDDPRVKECLHEVEQFNGEVLLVSPPNVPPEHEERILQLAAWCLCKGITLHVFITESDKRNAYRATLRLQPYRLLAASLRKLEKEAGKQWVIQISTFSYPNQAAEGICRVSPKLEPSEFSSEVMVSGFGDNRIGLTDAFLEVFESLDQSVIEKNMEEFGLGTRSLPHGKST